MFGLADREVNRGRQPEIDCLKAFCIFLLGNLRRKRCISNSVSLYLNDTCIFDSSFSVSTFHAFSISRCAFWNCLAGM